MNKSNIVLIGMPSSGKSTTGVPLSETLSMEFVDTDVLIKETDGRALRDIVSQDGLQRFIQIQEEVILGLKIENHVIATGGSVIYGDRSMMYLKEKGIVIYLKIGLEELEKRITPERRLARNNGQSFPDLYKERTPLYEKYADFTIECDGREVSQIINEITAKIK